MRIRYVFMCLLFCMPICYGQINDTVNSSTSAKNIRLFKNMFSEFAEKLDINKLDDYYSKNFILVSNNKNYNYQAYKELQGNTFKKLKNLKVISYDDIFSVANKVVSRMRIKLTNKNGDVNIFSVILIAEIKNSKINRIWEITYPSWSDKL